RLDALVTAAELLLHDHELRLAVPAEVPVEPVVVGLRDDSVLDVDRATEDLDAVVEPEVYLHVVDHGLRATAGNREAVELVVDREREPGVLDARVLELAAVV